MSKFKKGDRIRNIYNGQTFLVIEVTASALSGGYYIIKGESYPHKDKKWMLFFDAENEWRLIRNKKRMIIWETEKKPIGTTILAKLTKEFCGGHDHGYEVLHYNEKFEYYYDNGGEEIPYGAIEKWSLIEG